VHNELLQQPSLGHPVNTTQLTPSLIQPLYTAYWQVDNVTEEEDECEPLPLASTNVSNSAFESVNPPSNFTIYYRKDSAEAGE
jgi:hypothetical protein